MSIHEISAEDHLCAETGLAVDDHTSDRSAACRGGDDLVIDEMLLAPDLLPVWMDALAGLEVLLVGVMCPLSVAEEREVARGNESGLARGHLRTVHEHGFAYDITVDTSTAPPTDLAKAVLRHPQNRL